jgi:PAS domain-containing protein
MANFSFTADFYRLFETVRIPFVVTDCDLNLIYANQFAQEVLPLPLDVGKKLNVEDFLQPEDSTAFDAVVSECKEQGEGIGTLKQKGIDKYFKVKAYYLKGENSEIIFHFDDISQVRVLETQFYDHLVDLYNELETKEREIATLKSSVLRSRDLTHKL